MTGGQGPSNPHHGEDGAHGEHRDASDPPPSAPDSTSPSSEESLPSAVPNSETPPTASSLPIPFARPIGHIRAYSPRSTEHPLLLRDLTRKGAWADVGVFLGLMIGLVITVETVIGLVVFVPLGESGVTGGLDDPAVQRMVFRPLLVGRLMITAALIVAFTIARRQQAASVGLSTRSWGIDTLLGVASIPVTYGLNMAWVFIVWSCWPDLMKQFYENSERLAELIPRGGVVGVGALALAISVYEELLFRGFLLPRLRRATGSWVLAVFLSTAVFTALHGFDQTPAALVSVAGLSLIYSLLTIWRRSIVPAIVGHFLYDWVVFLWFNYMEELPV